MPKVSLIAAALLLLCGAAVDGCARNNASLSPSQVCASKDSLGRMKRAVFDGAVAAASSQNRYALGRLSEQSQARLVDPLVESFDHDTKKTTCTATLEVLLPAGVLSPREIRSPIRYVSQPTADGRTVVFSPSGLEQVASAVAGADVSDWAAKNAPRRQGLVIEVVPQSEIVSSQQGGRVAEPAAPVERSAGTRALALAAPTAAPSSPPVFARTRQPERVRALVSPPSPIPRLAPSMSASIVDRGPGKAERPVRVFVHIADPSQTEAADRVRSELNAVDVAEQPVATPPVRYVARSPRRNEVRCLKRADCPAARLIGRRLAQILGAPVAIVDMSSTYERDAGVRAGSLEFWLRAQASGTTD